MWEVLTLNSHMNYKPQPSLNDKVHNDNASHYIAYYGLHSQQASLSDYVVSR